MARVWHLRARPTGSLSSDIFVLEDLPDPPLAPGEVRIANEWLSVDPFMRGLLDDKGGYMPALPLGSAMYGGGIGTVVESRNARIPVGSRVLHDAGWRDRSVVPGELCQVITEDRVPIQRYLGHLGMPGQTAYFGLLDAAQAREGDTLFVSAAAGAVGSAVVQIGRILGMRVIASAGGAAKCEAIRRWGADVVIDRTSPGSLREKLAAAAPEGIDVYFDNVGGDHLDAAIECAKIGARFALCGMIGGYGKGDSLHLPQPMRLVIKRIRLQGFIAPDYDRRQAEFRANMLQWTLEGKLVSAETVFDGLESVPDAFIGLFDGRNLGKMLVKL